jgi:chromosome segregation ATPase
MESLHKKLSSAELQLTSHEHKEFQRFQKEANQQHQLQDIIGRLQTVEEQQMEEQKHLRDELDKRDKILNMKEQQISVQEQQIQALGTANSKLISKLTELRDRFASAQPTPGSEHRASSC